MFRYLIILLCAIAVVSCSQTKDDYEVVVNSSEYNNMTVRLLRETGNGITVLDSNKLEMKKAVFSGNVTSPELMYIVVEGVQDYLPVFVENSRIEVDINAGRLSRSTVTGSESNKIFSDFLLSYSSYNDKANGLSKMLCNAYDNHDTVIIRGLEKQKRDLKAEMVGFQRLFVSKYISSPVACYILSSHLMYELGREDLKSLMDSIPQANRENRYYFKAKEYLSGLKEDKTKDNETNTDTVSNAIANDDSSAEGQFGLYGHSQAVR